MSDAASEGSNPWEPVIFIIAVIGILTALIWVRGGLDSLRGEGFFINPTTPFIEGSPTPQTATTNPTT